jgi:DNA-binding transcriptional regulator LsrR (DeoR family)
VPPEKRRLGRLATGELMLEVARAYYLRDRSKVQIAEDTGLSRWQVARLLTDARAQGIVTIRVGDPGQENAQLGAGLAAALGIERAIVIGRSRGLRIPPTIDSIAQALAGLLTATVTAGQRIGLTWSRVIEAMPAHLDRLAPCEVVQLAGALTFAGDRMGSVEVIRQIARIADGTAYPIYAPLFAASAETADSLSRQPEIQDVLRRAAELDIAVVGLGTWTAEGSIVLPLVPAELAAAATRAGAVAEISGRVFGPDGEPVAPEIDARIIGITAAELRAVPHIIAAGYGAHRAEAAIAAARGGFVRTLLVDEPLADAILKSLG